MHWESVESSTRRVLEARPASTNSSATLHKQCEVVAVSVTILLLVLLYWTAQCFDLISE